MAVAVIGAAKSDWCYVSVVASRLVILLIGYEASAAWRRLKVMSKVSGRMRVSPETDIKLVSPNQRGRP